MKQDALESAIAALGLQHDAAEVLREAFRRDQRQHCSGHSDAGRMAELVEANALLSDANEEVGRQVEALREQSLAIEVANRELKDANRDKSEFLSIAAHDLKNPLAGIQIALDNCRAMIRRGDPVRALELIETIGAETRRMTSIVTKLLDLNKIESEGIRLTPAELDMAAVVRAAAGAYRERCMAKRVALEVHAPAAVLAHSDEFAVSQILDNLISNAVKFSPPGGVVSVALHTQSATCSVVIADQGCGIPEQEQHLLFRKYAKLSPRPTGGEKSSGLGLSIVKKLGDALGARLSVASAQGEGTAITVVFPLVCAVGAHL